MEESSSWVTYAIITIVVVLVVGLIIYSFYPETWKDIENVAGDVFQFGAEKAKGEATQEAIEQTIADFTSCVEKQIENCGCEIDSSKIPDGYKVVIKNIGSGESRIVAIQGWSGMDAPVGNAKEVTGIGSINLAVAGSAETAKGIVCSPADFTLVNQGGKIVVQAQYTTAENAETGLTEGVPLGPYSFYAKEVSPQVFKQGKNVCFITNAIEKENIGGIRPPQFFITSFNGMESEWANNVERKRILLQELTAAYSCSGTVGTDFSIVWPVAPEKIASIDSCANNYGEQGSSIKMSVEEGSDVVTPVFAGVVADYCAENCGEEGMSITIYEVFNHEKNWPTGRSIKIAGLKSLKDEYKVKARFGLMKIAGGADINAGDALGTAGNKLVYYEDFPEIISSETNTITEYPYSMWGMAYDYEIHSTMPSVDGRFCNLPRLAEEKYSGEKCERVIRALEECPGLQRAGLGSLVRKISLLEDGKSGNMGFNFNIGRKNYAYLIGFAKGQVNLGDDLWNCENTGVTTAPILRPSQCLDNDYTCLCLCESLFCEEDGEVVCELVPSSGFQPKVMKGGSTCDHGILVPSKENNFANIYYQRSGDTLGICTSLPCV